MTATPSGYSGPCYGETAPGASAALPVAAVAPPSLGAESLKAAHDGARLPAPIALRWEAGDVFSPGAMAHR